jgi:hypothetical protein
MLNALLDLGSEQAVLFFEDIHSPNQLQPSVVADTKY